jgi:hypothetical protein
MLLRTLEGNPVQHLPHVRWKVYSGRPIRPFHLAGWSRGFGLSSTCHLRPVYRFQQITIVNTHHYFRGAVLTLAINK